MPYREIYKAKLPRDVYAYKLLIKMINIQKATLARINSE